VCVLYATHSVWRSGRLWLKHTQPAWSVCDSLRGEVRREQADIASALPRHAGGMAEAAPAASDVAAPAGPGPSDEEVVAVLRKMLAEVRCRPQGQAPLLRPAQALCCPHYLPTVLINGLLW
jgi:hypothetical protein